MKRSGVTLLELLVAIAIIGLLIALLMPAIGASREAGRRADCNNRLRQLAVAVQNYEATHGVLPPANSLGHSYLVCVLPQMELDHVYRQARFDAGAGFALDNPLYRIPIGQFTCPSDGNSQASLSRTDTVFPTNYVANTGVNTVDRGYNGYLQTVHPHTYGGGYLKLGSILDGQSNTAMLSETLVGDPADVPRRVILATPAHYGKGQYADFLHACANGPYRSLPTGGLDILPSRGACWPRACLPQRQRLLFCGTAAKQQSPWWRRCRLWRRARDLGQRFRGLGGVAGRRLTKWTRSYQCGAIRWPSRFGSRSNSIRRRCDMIVMKSVAIRRLCVVSLIGAMALAHPAICAGNYVIINPANGSTIANGTPASMNGTGAAVTGATYRCRIINLATMTIEGDGPATMKASDDTWVGVANFTPSTRLFYTSGAAKAQFWEFVGFAQNPKASNDVTVS